MSDLPYLVPAAAVITEEEIKKSRFITHLAHTPTVEAAKAFVDQVKREHAAARHNCWAFVAGRPENSMLWGFSDDGEPSGTAGKPILAQLSGSGVGEITAVVTRYSGGIKLGTGGLVKAYGGGVQIALTSLQTIEKQITVRGQLRCAYSQVADVESLLSQYKGKLVDTDYGQDVVMCCELEKRVSERFATHLFERSSGQITVSFEKTSK
ncbi:YigZ family protein [Thaumasiovibrio subtropicus]|uniref:YigZ family protein n=1 Tax=Thaumasiovibrio subtropicus TaxID=1891207 RepID=UPI000B358B3E|nr:YigZ family protein [Thaumasiovibrio subtropicus]